MSGVGSSPALATCETSHVLLVGVQGGFSRGSPVFAHLLIGLSLMRFFHYFHCKSIVDNDMPGAWPVWTPGVLLTGFIKRSTTHCSTQNMKALGLVISE